MVALAGRDVTIWPDHDAAGTGYALDVRELVPHAKIVEVPAKFPTGWDLADAWPRGVEEDELFELVRSVRASPATSSAELFNKLGEELAKSKKKANGKAAPTVQSPTKLREREAAARKADKYISRDGTAPLAKSAAAAIGKEAPDLSMLDDMGKAEYGRRRAEISERTGIALKYLDMEYAERRKTATAEARSAEQPHWQVDLWPEEVDGEALILELTRRLRRHVVMDKESALVVALWIVFAWVHDAAVHSPLLLVRSPEAECGKSTLLGLLSFMVPRGMVYVGGTAAVIYRMIEKWHPTLIVDEADNVFKDNPDICSVINSGWTRGAGVPRCNHETNEPEFFLTFGPKAIGAIGRRLPPQTLSRSIVIEMTRKLPGDRCDEFDHTDDAHLAELRQKLARFAHDNIEKIGARRPAQPDGFANRLAANWRTMLGIAEICGTRHEAREAAEAVSRRDEEASLGVELLRDIKGVFEELRRDRVSSDQLVNKLVNMTDRPWCEMPYSSKPITQLQLAKLLKPFGVKPKTVRIAEITIKGYALEWFDRAFRYIPIGEPAENSRHTVTNEENGQKSRNISETPSVTNAPLPVTNVTAKMAENSQC